MFLIIAVAVVWTVVVIGFSTSMGSRPLRIYDWGPPVGALLLTLIAMLIDKAGSASQRMNREVTPA